MLMQRSMKTGALVIVGLGFSTQAQAHLGHLGEVAGHSHWAGVAALAGAVIIAGVLAVKGRKKSAESPEEITAEDDVETPAEGETA